jgi:hypothetical protein
MAGNGPPPNPHRRRRNADTYAGAQTLIQATSSKLRGPSLAKATGGQSILWQPELRELVDAWWTTWRRSGTAVAFLETDWSRLTMLIPLVKSYFDKPHYTKLAEIRQNESLLGATVVDRLKARIKVEDGADPVAAPGVTALDDYRNRLGAG